MHLQPLAFLFLIQLQKRKDYCDKQIFFFFNKRRKNCLVLFLIKKKKKKKKKGKCKEELEEDSK
jgi:hypothetical protein